MKTRLIVALLVIAVAVAASVMINAAPRAKGGGTPQMGIGGPGGGPMGMHLFGKLAKQLKLTDAQIADLKRIHQEFLTATEPAREQLKAKCKEMIDLWSADQPNAEAIKALAAEMAGLKAEIRDAGIDHMVRGLNVLTPEQRAKLREIIRKHGGACMMMGHGMCAGPGCGMGMGPGPGGRGTGMGPGWGTGSGPRAGTPACPMTK